jgi:hypothetical protein
MKLNNQRNEYLLEYLKRSYDAYLLEAVRAEIGEAEYLKHLEFIRTRCTEATEFMLGTTEHHLDEILGEFYESKVV